MEVRPKFSLEQALVIGVFLIQMDLIGRPGTWINTKKMGWLAGTGEPVARRAMRELAGMELAVMVLPKKKRYQAYYLRHNRLQRAMLLLEASNG